MSEAPTNDAILNLLGRWGCKPIDDAGVCRDLRELLLGNAAQAHQQLHQALKTWFLHGDKQATKRHITAAYGLLDQILSTGPSEAPQAASAESDSPPADSRPDGLVGPTSHDLLFEQRPTGLKEG